MMEFFLYFGALLFSICFVGFMNSRNTIHIMRLIDSDRELRDLRHEMINKQLKATNENMLSLIKLIIKEDR